MIGHLQEQIRADADFYHELKRPGAPDSAMRVLATALSSKGWWLLAFQRVSYCTGSSRDNRTGAYWILRLLEAVGVYICAMICRSETMGDCRISGPVYFSDTGLLMIGASAIGGGTIIHQRVSLGMSVANGGAERPVIGNDVWIGSDCVIAGGIHVGDGATVLPGSYLTFSVPARAVVSGNPARISRRDFDNSYLRRSLKIVTELPLEPGPSK